MLFDLLFQGTSITIFIDEIIVIGCFEDLDESDDMSGILDLWECLDFIDSELF